MLVLASASPRRKELLSLLVREFEVLPADIDETPQAQETPQDYVLRMAEEKAIAAAAKFPSVFHAPTQSPVIFVASDTSVVVDQKILGKPANLDDAMQMLRMLSGRSHQVMTSLCLMDLSGEHKVSTCVNTDVTFRAISDLEIEQYWRSGEPQDKAGSYAIQGHGAVFVASMQGSYSAVVGLPLFECAQLLSQFGIHSLEEMSHE